ncbi:hypothetical protein ACFLU6_02215 [Acidobacteriota bacterium]
MKKSWFLRSFCLGISVLSILILAGIEDSAFAQATFSQPINVSQSADHSYRPDIVVEPGAGTVRLFWQDFTSNPILLWCAELSGSTWTAGSECVPNRTQSWEPQAIVDSQGLVHLVWRDRTSGQDDILYALWDGQSWSMPLNIAFTAGRSSNPAIAVNSNDHPHVLWEDDTSGTVTFYEAHFDGSSWSSASDTSIPYSDGSFNDSINIACDSTDTLHAVWFDGTATFPEIYHAERPPGGPWGVPEAVSATPAEHSDQPAIAVGPDDSLHCAWIEQEPLTGMTYEVVYSVKPLAGLWSAFVDVSRQLGQTYKPDIAVHTADNQARITWMLDGPGNIYFVSFPGETPINVSDSGDTSERPTLTLDASGHAFLAWQERFAGIRDIYFATTRPASILLKAIPDHANSDVQLSWTGGNPNFVVGRSTDPDVSSNWTDLSPVGGTPDFSWIDIGVLSDINSYYYQVIEY